MVAMSIFRGVVTNLQVTVNNENPTLSPDAGEGWDGVFTKELNYFYL
jgi:hypothetical protein